MTAYPLSRAATPNIDGGHGERASASTHDLLDHRARRREALARDHDDATEAEPVGPACAPRRGTGPSARLRALPQPTAEQLATPGGVDDHLADLEAARQAQLDALPATARNVAAAAHRATVAWILEQVRAARQRLRDDLYEVCARCGASIGPGRVDMQPWQTTCNPCAPSDRPVLSPPSATRR